MTGFPSGSIGYLCVSKCWIKKSLTIVIVHQVSFDPHDFPGISGFHQYMRTGIQAEV